MVRNGLYSYTIEALDGLDGVNNGVFVLRDGALRGGSSFFYFIGTYSCAGSKWKGEIAVQEHTPAPLTSSVVAGKLVDAGFSGTYTDNSAEFEATALVGKRSLRFHASLRLLKKD